jgi:glycosyltransferase involved in cell wall biosynthesis
MKIAIDVSHINRDGAGIGYVIKGLIEGFKAMPEHDYLLYSREPLNLDLPSNFRNLVIPHVSRLQGGGFRWYSQMTEDMRAKSADLYISTTLNISSMYFANTMQIIYDLTPLTNPEYYRWQDRLRFRIMLGVAVRSSRWLATISQTSAKAMKRKFKWLKSAPVVIPLGLNEWVNRPSTAEDFDRVKAKYDLPKKYFFSISTIQPRKNYIGMIKAFAQFEKENPGYKYYIAGGKGWYYEEVFALVKKLNLEDKIVFTGYAPEEDLPALFDNATAILYVSHAEGYGLIVGEAMARGVPVLAADLPVLREIASEDVAVFAKPKNVSAIVAGMEEVSKRKHYTPDTEFFKVHNWANTTGTLVKSARL